MEGRGNLILTAIIIILILSVVVGTIFYLSKNFRGRLNLPGTSPTTNIFSFVPSSIPSLVPSPTTVRSVTTMPTNNTTNNTSSLTTYYGSNFSLSYPKNWGLLTCSTSKNFELDPYNSTAQTIPCDFAVKPITILVGTSVSCLGTISKIGSYQVRRSVTRDVSIRGLKYDTVYRWCFNAAGNNFDISHRVSKLGYPASSKDDFSSQVEQMISTIH